MKMLKTVLLGVLILRPVYRRRLPWVAAVRTTIATPGAIAYGVVKIKIGV